MDALIRLGAEAAFEDQPAGDFSPNRKFEPERFNDAFIYDRDYEQELTRLFSRISIN
ncbi:hypothetical protein [Acanthopleuribacter pedis]|uniref:Uncharacterized protein n=1 Tax=Acanthopleuribacter pedis TaxID=442870 RepID=A0A8J7Q492_9BACT|nr:hypothetical protein [Acanthopleuribacter pedis]MBO1317772.1 hypothetical protein [Acanthopleuribacter pedis]